MPIEILLPAFSPSMSEGVLASWQISVGDQVNVGDVIAEIETDKATLELEAKDTGILGKILVEAGHENVAVNKPIGLILTEGEDPSSLDLPLIQPEVSGAAVSVSNAPLDMSDSNMSNDLGISKSERHFVSPLARRIAAQSGIDLAMVTGTGPSGRIVKLDVEAASKEKQTKPAPVEEASPDRQELAIPARTKSASNSAYDEVPNSTMRKVIARRLTESKRDIPHFYLRADCRIDSLLKLRQDLNGRKDADCKLSVNDFVLRAVALSLRKVPAVNASWSDEAIKHYHDVDISVAVAIDGGLITPIVRNADHKGLATISNEVKELASRARDGALAPDEYQGGNFSVSNLGMFGVSEFSAIINPPQSGILAIGAGEERPVIVDGALAVATVMSCTLSVDHRVVDGAIGAEFLASFKRYIEEPITMLL